MSAITHYNPTHAVIPARSDLQNLTKLAGVLSNSGVLPKHLTGQPAKVMAIALKGAELGVAPMAALTGIHIVEGKPTISGELMRSLAMRAGHRVYVDADNDSATVTVIRGGDTREQSFTFTMEDARRAGLANKNVWKSYPQAMLSARATSLAMRAACPDVLNGASYTPEELGAAVDVNDDGETVVLETVRDQGPARIACGIAQRELVDSIDGDTDLAKEVWTAFGFEQNDVTREELDHAIEEAHARLDERFEQDDETDTVDAEVIDEPVEDPFPGPDFDEAAKGGEA